MPVDVLDKKNRPDLQDMVIPADGEYWGGLNRYDLYSRWTIADEDFDFLVNWLPMGSSLRQTPGSAATLATLASTVVWITLQPLNQTVYFFALCQNGHLYQVSLGGTIVDVSGATSLSANCDIAVWQGTDIIISDPNASKVYDWNGTTFTTALTSVKFSFIEVFSNRLWGANNNTLTWTNINTFNSLGGDAGAVIITDGALLQPINALKAFLGSLYIFSTNYIATITNLVDIGTPAVLTFSITTLELAVGTTSKWSIVPIGSSLYFANSYGIWVLNGSVPQLVSGEVNGLINAAQTGTSLSGGFFEIYSQPCIGWHVKTIDGNNSVVARTVVGESEQQQLETLGGGAYWFLIQDGGFVFITSYVIAGVPSVYGCDGTNIFQLAANTTSNVTSMVNTKLWNQGHQIQEDVVLYFGVSLLSVGATVVAPQWVNQQNVVVATPAPLGASAPFNWTNNFVNFNWSNGGSAFVWTNFSTPQWRVWQFNVSNQATGTSGGAIFQCVGINLTINGIGSVLQKMYLQFKKTPSTWGFN